MKGWITVAEASRRLNISERSVRTWIAENKLKARKQGRRWLIAEDSIGGYGGEDAEFSEATADISEDTGGSLPQELAKLKIENQFLRAEIEELRKDKQDLQESRTRQDTIIMQLSRNLESQQLLLEDLRRNEPFWRRWFRRRERGDRA